MRVTWVLAVWLVACGSSSGGGPGALDGGGGLPDGGADGGRADPDAGEDPDPDAAVGPGDADAAVVAGDPDAGVDPGDPDAGVDPGEPDAGMSDACADVVCDSPPPPVCVSPTRLRTRHGGTCSSGVCSYASTDVTCADACQDGACVTLSCGADSCDDSPLADHCVNAQTLSWGPALGVCDPATMTCQYQAIESFCTEGCAAGACAPGSWLMTRAGTTRAITADLTVDASGRPVIAMIDDATTDLVVLSFGPHGWQRTVVDPLLGYAGYQQTAWITSDAAGGIHIGYTEPGNANVRYAHRAPGASTFTVEFVATAGLVSARAIAVDASGRPTIALVDDTVADLRTVRRNPGGGWTTTHHQYLTPHWDDGRHELDMTLDAAGEPIIAHTDWTQAGNVITRHELRVGFPVPGGWTFEDIPDESWSFRAARRVVLDRATGDLTVLVGGLLQRRSAAGAWRYLYATPAGLVDLALANDGSIVMATQDGSRLRLVTLSADGSHVTELMPHPGGSFGQSTTAVALAPDGTVHACSANQTTPSGMYHFTPAN
jgi:hypothetical protein